MFANDCIPELAIQSAWMDGGGGPGPGGRGQAPSMSSARAPRGAARGRQPGPQRRQAPVAAGARLGAPAVRRSSAASNRRRGCMGSAKRVTLCRSVPGLRVAEAERGRFSQFQCRRMIGRIGAFLLPDRHSRIRAAGGECGDLRRRRQSAIIALRPRISARGQRRVEPRPHRRRSEESCVCRSAQTLNGASRPFSTTGTGGFPHEDVGRSTAAPRIGRKMNT